MARLSSYEADRLNDAIYGMDDGGNAQERVTARFVRTDPDGTSWVRFEGADKDTPLTSSMSVMAREGDLIDVRLGGYEAVGGGNRTDPSAGFNDVRAVSIEVERVRGKQAEFEKVTAQELEADKARIGQLEADSAEIEELVAQKAEIDDLQAAEGRISDLESDHVSTQDLTAVNGEITNLKAKDVAIEGNITAATGRIGTIEADYLKAADMTAEQARVNNLLAGKATVNDLNAATGRITVLESTKADISDIEANYITADDIEATYMHANMSNSDVAWIQNGVIANGAISSAMINDVSANKLTAGTINGSVINVTNLNADNITAGTINGQRIGAGSLSLDKLSEDVYTEAEVDAKLSSMQAEIDGAIETWTGTEVPTLNNAPASAWTTAADRDKHVGDVYFNTTSGYNYRFTKSGSTYSWLQIKDTDITNALQRIQTAEGQITQFDSDISTLKTDTGELKTKTQSLETSLGDKVDTTTFNELEDTVDGHSQTISQHTTAISQKADTSTVNQVTNRVTKAEQDISGINTTIGQLQTTVEGKADGSTVTTISNKLNTVSDTVDGHTQTISSVQSTLSTKADSSTVQTLRSEYNETKTTVAGTVTKLASVEETANGVRSDLDSLEIGGRNLLKWSRFDDSKSYNRYHQEYQSISDGVLTITTSAVGITSYLVIPWTDYARQTVTSTDTLTFSFDYKYSRTAEGTTNPYHGFQLTVGCESGAWYIGMNPDDSDTGGEWMHYQRSIKLSSTKGAVTNIVAEAYWRDIVGTASYKNVKLEKGNKPSDWTPAPEDLETEVTSLKTDYANYKQTTTEALSEIGTTYATKTELGTETSNRQTAIQQVNNAIALKANASDVYTKTDVNGLISTEVSNRNSAIQQSAENITATVSSTYATKAEARQTASDSGKREIVAEDAAELPLISLAAYGESVQDGTPTPDNPVPVQVVSGVNMLSTAMLTQADFTETNGELRNTRTDTNSNFRLVLRVHSGTDYRTPISESSLTTGQHIYTFTIPVDFNADRLELKHNGSSLDLTLINANMTFESGKTYTFMLNVVGNNPTVAGGIALKDIMLAQGVYASYIPYGCTGLQIGESITPIDLQGHTLAGLPDGTRDVLRVDSAGHVTLTKNVASHTFDGQGNYSDLRTMDGHDYVGVSSWGLESVFQYIWTETPRAGLCNRLECDGEKAYSLLGNGISVDNGGTVFLSLSKSIATTRDGIIAWLAANPVTLYGRAKTPEVITLGTISTPYTFDDATVKVLASIQPLIDASWWTKAGYDAGKAVSTAEAELKVQSEAISLKVSKNDVVNQINLSTEGAKIHASKVEIDGTTTFTSGGTLASYVDGKVESAQEMHEYTIDLSGYDQDTWYPVITAGDKPIVHFVMAFNGGGGTPSWSIHSSKSWACNIDVTYYPQNWGWKTDYSSHVDAYAFGQVSDGMCPVTFSNEFWHSARLVMYMRGGGVYTFQLNQDVAPAVHAETYTFQGQSVSPTTTQPVPYTDNFVPSLRTTYSTASNAAPKTNAVNRTQRIYYRSNAAITSWSMPTSWVTNDQNTWNGGMSAAGWSTKVTPIANGTGESVAKYLYLYTCEQRQMADGTIYHTPVTLDESTTVIDGGQIITHSVTANQLNAASINASNSLTVGALTAADQASVLNSNVQANIDALSLGGKGRWFASHPRELSTKQFGYYGSDKYIELDQKVNFSKDFAIRVDFTRSADYMTQRYCLASCYDGSPSVGIELRANYGEMRVYSTDNNGYATDRWIGATPAPGVKHTFVLWWNSSESKFAWLLTDGETHSSGEYQPSGAYSGECARKLRIGADMRTDATWNCAYPQVDMPALWLPEPPRDADYLCYWDLSENPSGEPVGASEVTYSSSTGLVNTAAQTATNYISIDPVDGIRIADANPGSASTYQRQTSTATEFVVGGERTAQFGGSGATIGKDDELQLKMTAGAMALENDTDDEVFSVTENAGTIISRTADLVTFASASDVSTTTYSVSDSLSTADAPTVTFEISGDIHTLDSTYATATATAGTGVSVTLTSDGVDFITGLFEEAEGSGVLAVDYNVSHYDQAVLDMDGSMTIDGEGDIVKVVNTGWTAADSSNTFFIARNEVTGKELRIGVGAGGYNRGIYDAGGSRWLAYADKNNVSNANLDNVYGRGKRSVRIGAAAPSTADYFGKLRTYDAKGDVVFYSESVYTSAKDLYRSFVCRRFSSNGKTKYDNGFYLHVDNSGNPSVSFTSGGAAAWRDGLGLGTAAVKDAVDIVKYVSGTKSYKITTAGGTASVAVSISVPSGYAIRGVTRVATGYANAMAYAWTWSGSTVTVSIRNNNTSGWDENKTCTVGVICTPTS